MPDPRDPRGVRYPLPALLTVAVCAVTAGASSFAAITDWLNDLDEPACDRLGFDRTVPVGTTVWRLLTRLDATRLTTVLAGWLHTRSPAPPPIRPRRYRTVIAVDGKTLRGARRADGRQVHLLSALDTATGIVLGRLDGILFVADALHTQTSHAHEVAARGAHLMTTVKANQCATRRSDTSPPQAGQTRREVCWV